MDNAKIHKSKLFQQKLKEHGISEDRIIYNVPYSPKYNPIEYSFNTQKELIKKNFINTLSKLKNFLESYDKITNNSYEKYFKKSLDHLFDDENY